MAFPERVVNFGAGPAQLPLEVLKEAQANLLNYNNCGQSILECAFNHNHRVYCHRLMVIV